MEIDPTSDEAFQHFLLTKAAQTGEDDRALMVDFFTLPKLLGFRSNQEGRPIYEDQDYCRIRIKGQPHQVVVEEVTEQHKQRFPIAYHAFLQKRPQAIVGTPIEQLPGVGRSTCQRWPAAVSVGT